MSAVYVRESVVKRRAIELGEGRIKSVSQSVLTACDLAVDEVLRRALAQNCRTSSRLDAPGPGLPARKR